MASDATDFFSADVGHLPGLNQPFDVNQLLDQQLARPPDLGHLHQLPDPEPLVVVVTTSTIIEFTEEGEQYSEPFFQTSIGSDISSVEGMNIDRVNEASTQTDLSVLG